MFQNNGAYFPRTAGGYSLETYEPVLNHPEEQKLTEDLVRMAFTDKKPLATVKRIVPRMTQLNTRPNPFINGAIINPIQNPKIIYNNPNARQFQVIKQNSENSLNRFNNINNINNLRNFNQFGTGRTLNPNIKQNNFMYQNLVRMNYPNQISQNNGVYRVNPNNRYVVSNLKFQKVQPIMRSNSANFASRILKQSSNGPNYKPYVYKMRLK